MNEERAINHIPLWSYIRKRKAEIKFFSVQLTVAQNKFDGIIADSYFYI